MTRIPDRNTMLDVLQRALARAARDTTPVSVAMADVDGCMSVDRAYGPLIDAEAVCGMTKLLSSTLRPYDTVGCYSGEKFLFMLPGCGPGQACEVAERVQRHMSRQMIPTSAGPCGVIISLGVSSTVDIGLDANDLIIAADKALYQAKQAGGNRVAGPHFLSAGGSYTASPSVTGLASPTRHWQ